jgi:predicted O-methyltransferase YrrM
VDSERWKSVDAWFADHLVGSDEGLDHALIESDRAGLRQISVSHNQGKLLYLLARMVGARRILEIGTLGGYSGIWFARALPADGILVTLEIDPKTAQVARSNFAHAGVDQRVDVRVGAAVESLQSISDEHQDPFDIVFVDADKENNPAYFEWALRLTKPGSVIIIDNVARQGRVIDQSDTSSDIEGVRRVVDLIASESRVTSTAIQTVGEKGYDGFLIALVTS